MKKLKAVSLIMVLVLVCSLVACSNAKTLKSLTFTVDTGDTVKVELDTTGGYDMTFDSTLEISQNGATLSQGIFISKEQYEDYIDAVKNDDDAKIIDSGTKGSCQYVFWSYNDAEFNFVMLIGNSSTGVLLGNAISEESARDCIDRLTISLENTESMTARATEEATQPEATEGTDAALDKLLWPR